tara:strand:- start:4635 stop:5228 length:594 start_codon:yes stop_codon:yes gene_type:complete
MSEYILYTDRKENFSCDIALEGAKLNESFARIILETKDINYVFNGSIDATGKCEIPIRALKGLMDVRDSGKMVLEVVADDTYFRPWESQFIVDAHTKLEVKINEQSQPSKPKIQVSVNTKKDIIKEDKPKPKKLTISEAINDMSNILSKNKISKKNFSKNKNKAQKLFSEYFTDKKISNKSSKNKILKEVIEKIIKG